MKELTEGLGGALRSLQTLNITVQHNVLASSRHQASTRNNKTSLVFAATSVITQTMCKSLAAVTPSLTYLSVNGGCFDAAFSDFGAYCPHLKHLKMEAINVPIKALKSLHTKIPNLVCFGLKSRTVHHKANELEDYVGAVLCELSSLTSLTEIDLDFDDERIFPKLCSRSWLSSSEKLCKLAMHCNLHHVSSAAALFRSIHELSITSNNGCLYTNIFDILIAAPCLLHVSLTGYKTFVFNCNDNRTITSILPLAERILGGLLVDISKIRLQGKGGNVLEVLAALPSLLGVQSCTLICDMQREPLLLPSMARVFPNLGDLNLTVSSCFPEHSAIEVQHLINLAEFRSIKNLKLLVGIKHVTSDLARLCLSLPSLKTLAYCCKEGISLKRLRAQLDAQGQHIAVEEYLKEGFQIKWQKCLHQVMF